MTLQTRSASGQFCRFRRFVRSLVRHERLGHANVSITLDIYSHVAPHMQPDAAERIDAGMRKTLAG